MQIFRAGVRPSGKGPAAQFTGNVRRDPVFASPAPGRVQAGINTFEPGARTAWHTHPLGQILVVMSGCGWITRWEEPVQEMRPGDVVWIPAGEKHWHGASATTAVVHLAITEALDGSAAEWLEHVSDEQYQL